MSTHACLADVLLQAARETSQGEEQREVDLEKMTEKERAAYEAKIKAEEEVGALVGAILEGNYPQL